MTKQTNMLLNLRLVPLKDLSAIPHLLADSVQVNRLIQGVRQNPRRVGEMGFCPQYVPEGKKFALSGEGLMEIV